MNRIIRKAISSEVADIMHVIEAAKGIMRSSGNMHQWVDGYPSESVILSDIEHEVGYVVVDDTKIVGYFAFIPSPDPTYAKIYQGEWTDDILPYHVIHRIASYPDVHNIFRDIIDFCYAIDTNLRVDTHRDNTIMQHNLLKHGFTYCGIIYLLSGDERLAYQKVSL
ncbi:MAG: N-acetyltransferase [Bacteroidaceae bacterium]|nr:N-acetyltransferase [Bacteroidaceae bacterium]